MRQSVIYAIARVTTAFVWIYHGLVPKLLFDHPDEYDMLIASGFPEQHARAALIVVGLAEITLGLLMLILWKSRSLFTLTIVLMIIALLSIAAYAPGQLVAAFNPVTLNVLVIALSAIGLVSGKGLPSTDR